VSLPVVKEMSHEELLAVINERQDQQARAMLALREQIAEMQGEVRALVIAEASRVKFLQGLRAGAQAMLSAITAAGGAATSKIVDWLSK
jgi:hypothetical protein